MNDPYDPYITARERMIGDLARKRGIRDERVLEAMRRIPRHLFVKNVTLPHLAYADNALSIGERQTISQPSVVARMTELLEVRPDCSVLEIGTGSGYQTAILALLARRVYSLERVAPLAREAIGRMRDMKLENVKVQIFDGTVGWSDVAPFDRILVTAAAPQVPPPLLDQLAPGGILVIPEGTRNAQHLVVYRKDAGSEVAREVGEEVSFVPLVGRHGWAAEETKA